ncbi:MAG: deoxyhypusine synthase family protein, partial [Patescibacteria group bacterium]
IYEFMSTLNPQITYSSAEFLNLFGKYQNKHKIDSITAAAYRVGAPIFSPGMADSGYGIAAYLLRKEKKLHIILDQFKDFEQLGKIGDRAKNTSVVYIGGGVPKDTIQLISIMKDLGRGGCI